MTKTTKLLTAGVLCLLVISLIVSSNYRFANASENKSTIFSPINAKGVAVVEVESGRELYGQNATLKLPMASTTKIATCITVIEHCKDLKRVVSVPDCAVGVEGSSIYLQRGEKQTIEDLLYGLMLQSGNDCAVTLAVAVGKSVENFASMMNETAQKAGAENTNFTNPHGLHDDNHYTTAQDLARITAYAMKNPKFCEIVATKSHKMPWEGRDYDRSIVNKNKILTKVDGGCGVKTGYTKKAGRCLVSAAERNGMTIVCVVLNCPQMFEDSEGLLSCAFDSYGRYSVIDDSTVLSASVDGGKENIVGLKSEKRFSYPLTKIEAESLEIKVEGVNTMKAPVKKGVKNGKISVYLEKRLIFSSNLYTIYDVEGKNLWEKLKDLLRN